MTSKRYIAASVAVLLLLAGCGKSDKKSSSTTTSTTATSSQTAGSKASGTSAASVDKVDIKNFAFGPKAVKAKVGASITWTNQDDNKHTVTSDSSDPEKFDSGDLAKAKTFAHTFKTAGTYKYFCNIHNYMTGTVEVS
jgi:plastocyanin